MTGIAGDAKKPRVGKSLLWIGLSALSLGFAEQFLERGKRSKQFQILIFSNEAQQLSIEFDRFLQRCHRILFPPHARQDAGPQAFNETVLLRRRRIRRGINFRIWHLYPCF